MFCAIFLILTFSEFIVFLFSYDFFIAMYVFVSLRRVKVVIEDKAIIYFDFSVFNRI